MKTRVIVAVVGIPLLLVVLLLLPPVATAILVAAMSVVAVYELFRAEDLLQNKALFLLSAAAAASVVFWAYLGAPKLAGTAGILLIALAVGLILVLSDGKVSLCGIGVSLFAGLLIPWLMSALVRIQLMPDGKYFILLPFVAAFSADSGAYFVGCAVGRHKLAPKISPKKTIEGAIGGLVSAIVIMMLYVWVMSASFGFEVNYLFAAIYGLGGAAVSVLGDLMFSVIKRQVGIKDYGNLLPGHGGVLDRFDSMCLVAPFTELLLLVIPVMIR